MHKCRLGILLTLTLLWVGGCGPKRLNVSKTFNVDGDMPYLEFDAQPKPQTIQVEFTSTGEVSVLLYKEEDLRGKDALINAKPEKALGKVIKGTEGRFSAEVPPNSATRLVIDGGIKKAEVKVKVTN
jgi:hypothetical protein